MSEFRACVDAKLFYDALSKVSHSAAKKCPLPVLKEACIKFDGVSCTLTCTDLERWCQATLPASGDTFSFVFTGTKSILTACRYCSGQLEFLFANDPTDKIPDPEGTLYLRNGERLLTRRTIPASDFPVMPEVKAKQRYPFDPDRLFERFKRVRYAISNNSNKPALCCVQFQNDHIITVDGYRLAVNSDPSLSVKAPFTIPPTAMDDLALFKGREDCMLCVGESRISFESAGLRLLTHTPGIDGFDLDHVIPRQFETEFTVSVNALWDEVHYLQNFLNAKTREPVRFDGRTLVLETSEGAYSSVVGLPAIPARGFNVKYLLEGLGQFKAKKVDTVTMKVSTPVGPIILTDGENELAMVLPVRLKNAA